MINIKCAITISHCQCFVLFRKLYFLPWWSQEAAGSHPVPGQQADQAPGGQSGRERSHSHGESQSVEPVGIRGTESLSWWVTVCWTGQYQITICWTGQYQRNGITVMVGHSLLNRSVSDHDLLNRSVSEERNHCNGGSQSVELVSIRSRSVEPVSIRGTESL